MRITDAAPEEAQLVELAERLSGLFPTVAAPQGAGMAALDLDPSYLEAARKLLAKLAEGPITVFHGGVELTEQQIENHLDFSPDFLDAAKDMLRDFIARTEALRER